MKLVEEYRNNKEFFKRFLEKNQGRNEWNLLVEFSAVCFIPVLALYVFYGEIKGFSDKVKDRIKSNCEFYGWNYKDFEKYFDRKED